MDRGMMGLAMDSGLPLVSDQGEVPLHPQSHPIYKMYIEFKDGDESGDR